MASLNLTILRGLPWINEIMNDIEPLAQNIKVMQSWIEWIGAFQIARVYIGKVANIVCFDSPDSQWSKLDQLLKEIN